MDTLSEQLPLDGGRRSSTLKHLSGTFYNVVPFALATLIFVVALFTVGTDEPPAANNSIQYLEASVLRLMMADELAIEGEIEKAGDQLDNALSAQLPKELLSPGARELFKLAAKIRDQIAAADRKSAVESLVSFRKDADEVSASLFKAPIKTRAAGFDKLAYFGAIGSFAVLGLVIYRRRRAGRILNEEIDEIARKSVELDDVRREFFSERERTTSLQQKLLDSGKILRLRDSELDEAARRVAGLENKCQSQGALIELLERKIAGAEADVASKRSDLSALEKKMVNLAAENREIIKSQAVVKDQIDVALFRLGEVTTLSRVREETLTNQFSEFKTAALARENGLTGDLENALSELRSYKVAARAREKDLTQEVNKLRAEAERLLSDFNSEKTILEWSNTKLKAETNDLMEEVTRLKSELSTETRRFSEQLAKIRDHGLA